ncbi:ladinin-1 [Sciurus carolinensis]|uniref:ladinin-1 n=1 Tax=Sciurus carolinensis TaxID=30640 RepID=UPI001FB2783A|nr:ladinin-1 [Sciurus carolinensis]
MSVSRKDWSALSSLARQRTLEDEEEQERERRRRHRNLSSTTDDESPRLTQNGDRQATERLPSVEEAEVPKLPPPASKDEDEDIQSILRTRQERRQRRQAVEAAQTPIQERIEAEEGRDGLGPGQAVKQPLVPKKEPEAPPRRRLSREQRGPWAREEEPGAGKKGIPEETSVSEKSPVAEKTAAPSKETCTSEKGPAPEKTSSFEKTVPRKRGSSERKPVPENTGVSDKSPAPEKTSVSEKTTASEKRSILEKTSILDKASVSEKMPERRLVSEKASIFEKSPVSETKPAPRKATASEPPQASGESQAKTKEQRGRTLPGKNPPSPPDPPTVASRLKPITLQVKIPSKEEEADASSPTQITYSSSLKRSSPRTISFRMSPRKDNSETALTRSASVRLTTSSVKLGEKLERYHTAIQRSESVRSQGSSRTEFFVAPVGVASKRHLFEKELAGQSRAEPTSSQKDNLRLSGVVTSRLNLWISKTQESGDQDPQEARRELAATKRTQWTKKSDASLDVEV